MSLDDASLHAVAEQYFAAWNSQDVEAIVACYTDDVVYRDPNTRGEVSGRDSMRRYLRKLLASWRMKWSIREAYRLQACEGAAILWRASLRRADGEQTVEVEGMDLVLLREGLIRGNDVYFDRSALAALMATEVM